MSWKPTEKEVSSVLKLCANDRYLYWIKRVADGNLVWSLWNDGGWALAANEEGNYMIPVWPHAMYAAICASDEWSGYEPKSISIDDWLQRWIPGIQRDKRMIAVFPTLDHKGIAVSPSRVADDLRTELQKYE